MGRKLWRLRCRKCRHSGSRVTVKQSPQSQLTTRTVSDGTEQNKGIVVSHCDMTHVVSLDLFQMVFVYH